MPKIIAGTYEQNLKQITTSLSDYVGRNFYPKEWPASLSDYEIVVETYVFVLLQLPKSSDNNVSVKLALLWYLQLANLSFRLVCRASTWSVSLQII